MELEHIAVRASHILFSSLVLVILCGLSSGCRTSYIYGTEIPDTEEHRAVYDKVMTYRTAMEERNVEAIVDLLSRRYYENSATTDRDTDDYGYEYLVRDVLPSLRENIKAVQYRVLMKKITVDGDRAWANFEYFCNYKFIEGGKEGWRQSNDFNRLEFVFEDGTWKIISGL